MPEERGLYPKMAVITQLVHFGRLAGMGRRDARDAAMGWLDQLGLGGTGGDNLETLSHGNQQRGTRGRTGARAPGPGPRRAVLGLGPGRRQRDGTVLREAAARGATILFSSHQLELVEDLCVDVAIINGGRTVAAGDLASIRTRAGYRRVEVSVSGAPWVPDGVGTVRVEGERAHVLVPETVTAEELLAAASAVGPVTSFRYEAPSLADLFHEAVAPVEGSDVGRVPLPMSARPAGSASDSGPGGGVSRG